MRTSLRVSHWDAPQGTKTVVDVIIPTRNRPALLPEALKSVQNQRYTHWRCWIAEDGETKETLDAVYPFLEDKRFRYLPGSTAGTPAAPRNRAILEGNSPYVAFLDDDDLWLPEKLEKQIDFMKSRPSCILLGCNAFLWAGTGVWNRSLPLYFRKAPFGQVAYKTLVRDNCFINSTVIVQRAVLQKSGPLNEAFLPPIGEDYDLWLRIGVLGEAWLMPDPLVVYRVWPSSSIGSRSKPDRRRNYEIKARIYSAALSGSGCIPSPLSFPENAGFAAACRYERDYYLAGPRCGGRLMFLIREAAKKYFLACT